MKPLSRSSYKVTCLAGSDKIITHFQFDRKNSSVHMHFFGETPGNKPANIQVTHAEVKFPDGKDTDVIHEILSNYSPVRGLKVESITNLKDTEESTKGKPLRIIVRFVS